MLWSNEYTSQFLRHYEKEPALWNTQCPEHKNKADINEAWKRIKCKLGGGDISITELRKKRDNLMSTYRKLRTKKKRAIAIGIEDVYNPDWPFYNQMSAFLDGVYIPRKPKFTDEDNFQDSEVTKETEENEEIHVITQPNVSKKRVRSEPIPKRLKPDETGQKVNEMYAYFKEINHKSEQDECFLYTKLLCKKLRGLTEKTRGIAMLEIDRLVFNLKQNESPVQPSHIETQLPPISVYQLPPVNYQTQIISDPQFSSQLQAPTSTFTNFQQVHTLPTSSKPSPTPTPTSTLESLFTASHSEVCSHSEPFIELKHSPRSDPLSSSESSSS